MKIRLSRARERLRSRLERRGRPALLLLPAIPLRPGNSAGLPEHLVNTITRTGCRYAAAGIAGGLASSAVLEVAQGVMTSMLMNKLKLAVPVFSGLVLLGFGTLLAAQHGAGKGRAVQPDSAISATKDASSTLALIGSTESPLVYPVHLPLTGRVNRVLTGLGARVNKGDPLVEFFSPDLAAAKNEYEAASVQHALDRKVLALSSRLPADNPVSRQTISDSEDAEARSRLRMKQARDRLLLQVGLSDKEIDRIHLEDENERSRIVLRSPMSRLIVRRMVVRGNQYDPKDTVFSIAREDPLWVTGSAPEQDLPRIKVGQDLTVSFAFDDRRVKARVESIDPRVDPQTHKFTFRTSIPNPDRRLKPGMFVRVDLETDTRHDSIDTPRHAGEKPLDPTTNDRLSELERKLDRLLREKDERSAIAKIRERLDALEYKVDQLLGGRQGKSP